MICRSSITMHLLPRVILLIFLDTDMLLFTISCYQLLHVQNHDMDLIRSVLKRGGVLATRPSQWFERGILSKMYSLALTLVQSQLKQQISFYLYRSESHGSRPNHEGCLSSAMELFVVIW